MAIQLKRAYLDIIGSILKTLLEGPMGKTKLATKANLDTRASQRYFEMLLRIELISFDENDKMIVITAKGRQFVEEFQRVQQFLDAYGL